MAKQHPQIQDFDSSRADGMPALRVLTRFNIKTPEGNGRKGVPGEILYGRDFEKMNRWDSENDAYADIKPLLMAKATNPDDMSLALITQDKVDANGSRVDKGVKYDKEADDASIASVENFYNLQAATYRANEAREKRLHGVVVVAAQSNNDGSLDDAATGGKKS